MKRYYCLFSLLLLTALQVCAGSIDDIRQALELSSKNQIQEKVYIHTDNQCYFVGDTLWFKAYVVRADNLRPTDMSRILYVELLSPDGLLVERQNIIVSPQGYTCGQFELKDSLYSGYYELRAYTRWMLNFNVRHHYYRTDETWWFYNKQMAADYFRIWDGLYSRVFPVYSKPETPGDYDARRMYQRPKTRLPQPKKDRLQVTFYPEGGHLVQGVENRVAFEVTDQHGEAVNIRGKVMADGMQPIDIATEYMGRGLFSITPTSHRPKARFTWRGKEWTVDLPKTEEQGASLRLEDDRLIVTTRQLPQNKDYAVSVLCRGALKAFLPINLHTSPSTIQVPIDSLPSGVADVTLFDEDGRIWADRLFFVNHHEHEQALISSDIARNHTYAPYEQVEVPVQLTGVNEPTTFSLSICDTNTDEPTYDDGNLMTDLLLSSELRGFIPRPSYYFEKDDAIHRRHLDLLMMVQGWRKYKWQELADTARTLRYEPEKSMTVEGAVYRSLAAYDVEPEEVANWPYGVGKVGVSVTEEDAADPFADTSEGDGFISTDDTGTGSTGQGVMSSIELGNLADANSFMGVNHGNLRHEVLVEAEISLGDQVVGAVQETENGRYIFNIPPFYGDGYLNMKAYRQSDSIKKNMLSRKDAKIMDEQAVPDYYVKRDVFFPIFTHDYTYYEKHQPEIDYDLLVDTLSDLSMENDVHQLAGVNVKGHRRGRRAMDWKKPAYVVDAYEVYNDITDRGLSFGMFDLRQFPVQVCKYIYGNMNRHKMYNVDGRLGGNIFYRNYSPLTGTGSEAEEAGLFIANRTPQWYLAQLKLKCLQDIRVFSDFEPRTEDSLMVQSEYTPDAIVEFVPIPDDGKQPTFRDRHLVIHGFNAPEEFYQPDYSTLAIGSAPTDYRRTLYWNPNAQCDADGRFTAVFYNNGKETRIKMTAAGIASDGRLLHSK